MSQGFYEGEGARKAREAREIKEKQEQEVKEHNASPEKIAEMESTFKATRQGVPETTLILVIAFDTLTNQIQLSGPIADKGTSYKLLELARDAIKDYNDKRMSGIEPL